MILIIIYACMLFELTHGLLKGQLTGCMVLQGSYDFADPRGRWRSLAALSADFSTPRCLQPPRYLHVGVSKNQGQLSDKDPVIKAPPRMETPIPRWFVWVLPTSAPGLPTAREPEESEKGEPEPSWLGINF